MKNTKPTLFGKWTAGLTLAASLLIMGFFTACPNAAGGGGGNTGGGSSAGPAYVKVPYAELDAYLRDTASSTEINYIEVTDIPAEHFNDGSGHTSTFGQTIQAAAPKKVALKLPKAVPGLTYMSDCFRDCTNLVSVANLPNGIEGIWACFEGCTGLTEIPALPSGVTSMGYCFSGCTGLTEIPDIPSSVEDMRWCFSGCTALKRVKLHCNYNPGNVGIEKAFLGLFKNCTALEKGGVQVPGAFLGNYTAAEALDVMKVPPAGNTAEQKKKFSAF